MLSTSTRSRCPFNSFAITGSEDASVSPMTVSDVISTLKKIKEMSHVSTTLLKKKNQAYKKQRENTELVKMSENSA